MAIPPTERLARALAYSTSNRASSLLSQMNRCGSAEWHYQFTCRTAGCASCRGRYIGKQVRQASARYQHLSNRDISFASIVIGATTCVDEIGDIFAKFRKDLRNLTDSNRRVRRRWSALDMMLWLEVDAMSGSDYILLGSDKQTQLGEMAPFFVMKDGPVWIVTCHGVIAHPHIDRQEVLAELDRRWAGHKRCDLRAFDTSNEVATNLRRTINYALKHECRTHLGNHAEAWPDAWMAEYYSYLNEWSRGFQSTRIVINSKKDKLSISPKECNVKEYEEEPMPFTYSNSIFPTYYN